LNTRKLLVKVVEKWPAKVLSVAAALILFVFHRMSTLESRFFSVPLQVEIGAGFVPVNSYPRLVRVTLRGDANSVFSIAEDDIEAYIDLSKYAAPGWYRSPVQIRKKGSALDVEPLEISVDPLEVAVQIERSTGGSLPPDMRMRGTTPPARLLASGESAPVCLASEAPGMTAALKGYGP
jgi:YbbR domain-containing protein